MRRAALTLLLIAGIWCTAAPAQARAGASAVAQTPDVNIPLKPAGRDTVIPPGFTINPAQAAAVAKTSAKMQEIHRQHHPLHYQVYVWPRLRYEVYFSFRGKVIGDVLVGPRGQLGPTYTGPLMFGLYARGGYGGLFDSPWVLAPFTLMFLLPLVLLRRRSWLDVADVAAVLSFGVSYALFDTGHLELSVWLAYPPLLYLLARMLIRGFRPAQRGGGFDVRLSTGVLVAGLLLLVAGRVAVTLIPHHVIDVAQASAIGAHKILHGQSIYFHSLGHPDTYGPIMYIAYVPFQAIFPGYQSGYLPSARAATIAFDLLTIAALFATGVRLRGGRDGRRLGLLMAWLWAACPATVLGLVKSTNDGLVALLAVLMMLALTTPVRRGILLGLATAAKFFPAVLLPLLAVGRSGEGQGSSRKVLAGFAIASGASVALFLPPGGLKEMWDHTLGFQLSRPDIFSPWALHPGLAPVKVLLEAGVVLLALVLAFRPRGPRTTAQVSALAAALIIAVQLPALHWFYFYIVWFLPLVLIAVLGAGGAPPASSPESGLAETTRPPIEPEPEPALVGAA